MLLARYSVHITGFSSLTIRFLLSRSAMLNFKALCERIILI